MIIPVTLAVALHTCAPAAAPDTMAAIVAVESAGWPYAINDNTARRTYRPRTRMEALRIAESAIRAHHSVDVGIAQVNSGNFAAFHVDAAAMLDRVRIYASAARFSRTPTMPPWFASLIDRKRWCTRSWRTTPAACTPAHATSAPSWQPRRPQRRSYRALRSSRR